MVVAARSAGYVGLLAATAALLACEPPPVGSCVPYTPELGRLAGSLGAVRPTSARLCGGFGYAAFEAADPISAPAAKRPVPGVAEASAQAVPAPRGPAGTARLIQQSAGRGTPEELAAAGVVSLLSGRTAEAVSRLEQALERAPADDARYLVDLANAYLARARSDAEPLDLLRAAETAERAVEIAPALPEARFTQAAALEKIGLRPEAAAAWRGFLAFEPEGDWSDEARRRLGALDPVPEEDVEAALLAAIDRGEAGALYRRVDRDRQRARELGETLLGDWAAAESAGDAAGATLALTRARALGRTLAELGGDRLLADSVAAIDRASAAPFDPVTRRRLVAGHFAHAEGRAADVGYQAAQARERFAEGERELEAAGSPFAGRSRVLRAAEAHRLSRWDEALEATAGLIADPGIAEAYPSLVARARWLHGLARLVAGSASAARGDYEAALDGFSRAGEIGNATYLRGLLGEQRWFVGERSVAWACWLEVLAGFDRLESPRKRHALADSMADALAELELPHLELRLRDRLVRIDDVEAPVYRCFGRLKRSRALLGLERQDEARHDLQLAEALLPDIEDDEIREGVRIDLLVSQARLAEADPERALDDLDQAIEHYRSRGRAFPLTQLHFARARLHRRRGDREAAERDLRAAIAALESQRGEIHEVLGRGAFLAGSETIFDELVALLAEQPGREAEALMAAEQGRSRMLLDLALRATPAVRGLDLEAVKPQPVPPLERILEQLPEGSEVLVYAVLETRTLAWILRPEGVEMISLEVTEAELKPLVTELVRAAGAGASNDAVASLGEQLSDLVYRPVAPHLTSGGSLLVVPDGPLIGLPFAALGGREPGRFLIEERTIALLPTAALVVEPEGRRNIAELPRLPLVVGPPEPMPAADGLPALPGAEREARAIAALYPRADRVSGAAATESLILEGLTERGLVHFAGHAIADPADPLGSALVLSADGSGRQQDGRLEALEILGRRFEHSPRVILAACATHDHAGRPETGVTLATALLAAGAGGVVAALWPVEDEVTEEMMVELHRELAAGAGLAEALATVQRRRAEGTMARAADWSAWVALGTPWRRLAPSDRRVRRAQIASDEGDIGGEEWP